MSSKTKILVFHMKELIYTGIFIVLGILFIILLAIMFFPGKDKENNTTETASIYVPGVYSTAMMLGSHTIDVEVIVDSHNIQSVELKNIDEAVTTMYPLIQPAFDDIVSQLNETGTLDSITYSDDNKYTSLVLLEAIRSSLDKAAVSNSDTVN